MIDKNYCMSSYLTFRFIEDENINFFENMSHKIYKPKNRDYIISICGKYKLHEVFYIFNKSKIVVTNDSGGYHIAMLVSDNVIVISSGANFIRFIDYPKQFKENKIISTPIPDKAKEFKYIEYYYDRDFLNTISEKSIYDLIDEKHYTKLM